MYISRKDETKLEATKNMKQASETTRNEGGMVVLSWGGRAKVLPSTPCFVVFHGLKLALCLGWKLNQRG